MISLPKYKELLGKEAHELTDDKIEQLRDDQYQIVELAFEVWAKNRGLKRVISKN